MWAKALGEFYEAIGADGRDDIEAVSMDLGNIYSSVMATWVPQAVICFDPFHVIQLANRALDAVYKSTGRWSKTGVGDRDWRALRVALRSGSEKLRDEQHRMVLALRRDRYRLFRAWELKERLRALYRGVEPAAASAHLKAWLTSAKRSRIPAFVNLARQIERCFDGMVAAVERRLSNSRLEGLNGKIRLIQRRGHGYHSVDSLTRPSTSASAGSPSSSHRKLRSRTYVC